MILSLLINMRKNSRIIILAILLLAVSVLGTVYKLEKSTSEEKLARILHDSFEIEVKGFIVENVLLSEQGFSGDGYRLYMVRNLSIRPTEEYDKTVADCFVREAINEISLNTDELINKMEILDASIIQYMHNSEGTLLISTNNDLYYVLILLI